MIKILNMNSGDAHVFFELLRMYFPYYEDNEDLILSMNDLGESFQVELAFPERRFKREFEKILDFEERRKIIGQWIIFSIDDAYRVENHWGILTGIRPIKFTQKLRISHSDFDVQKILEKEYFLKSELAALLLQIAKLESEKTKNLDPSNYSLYINIPFCPSRCHYCSYPTIKSSNKQAIIKYMSYLMEELQKSLEWIEKTPSTIYIGGGTPTSIPINELEKLLDFLDTISNGQEFTLEAGRPDTLSQEMLSMLSEHKISRISINPQTMNDQTLSKLGRNHSSQDIINTYYRARDIKDWQINMDLIIGLLSEGKDDLIRSIDQVREMRPENITVHTLSLKNGSKFFENKAISYKNTHNLEYLAYQRLKDAAYSPYYMYRQKRILGNGMNIGYSLNGKESLYNMIMMEELQTVLGIGMGSTSKIVSPDSKKIIKFSNFRNLKDYENRFGEILNKKHKALKERLNCEMERIVPVN